MKTVKRALKHIVFLMLSTVMLVSVNAVTAYACTAVYVGQDVSEDGTILLAKSNDYQDVWANYIAITERVENTPGRTMPVDAGATVLAEIPETTYRYTSTPWMDSAQALNGLGRDATVCTNECGVAMVMSITAFSNTAALEADPLIETGLTEFTAVDLVVCQSATAREGVETLCSILDTYGSSEINIALIADQTEVWYIEMYNGHEYAAVKLPSDAVCAFGNEFSLEYLSDYEDYITSPALESLAAEGGFSVYGRDGELNLLETYAGEEVLTDYSHRRTWIGHQLLAPAAYGEYDRNELYPLCFAPEGKVSVQDVMEILRNRFEGTEYSPDEIGRTDMRVIGTDTALSVHIAQIYPQLPADMACVTWESTGPAVYGVFVPVSNAALSVSEAYGGNQPTEEAGHFDTETYPYYVFKELTALGVEAKDYKVYGLPVRAYWHEAETGMTQGMGQVLEIAAGMEDREQAAGYITDYCNMMQMQAFSDAKQLLNDVRWYHSKNSNTLKNGRNPETGEVLDELKEIAPLEVTLAPDTYFSIPDIGGEQDLSAPTAVNVSIQHEEEFGGVYIELAIDEFNALGYAYGDSVTVTFSNGYTLESIPYYNGYYTQTGEPLLVAYPGYPYIKACVNNGDDLWLLAELGETDTAEITLVERGAYLDIQEARDIHYEDDRDLFLSDEVFANFRSVTCGDIQENRLYRSASPCDNQHNRASYADALIADAGVDQILDLADNEEKIQGYLSEQDFSSPYFLSLYEEGGVIPLSLNMNFSSDEFREKVATGLSALAEHPGSWLVHCTEGKDRTGFVCMLLEALCGASYEEIVSDYMITYDNYYGITSQSDPARYEVIVENVLDPMILCVIGDSSADPASVDLSESAARYLEDAGMSGEQVAALREALTAEP